MTTPGKLAYLAKRNPALSREQFIRRWRQHGALAMGPARWDSVGRYAQCDCAGSAALILCERVGRDGRAAVKANHFVTPPRAHPGRVPGAVAP
jgi:hypothetical protein